MYIDIGPGVRRGRKLVSLGNYCFDSEFVYFGDGRVKARHLMIGLMLYLIESLKGNYPFDLYACLSPGGSGLRGQR